jgi:hypothetical protein
VIPLDGKPKRLRPVTTDVEKQQAVVEAFRVSPSSMIVGGFVFIGLSSMLG